MSATKRKRVRVDSPPCRVVDRGPNWLFVRVEEAGKRRGGRASALADRVWEISEQHFVYRVVLELEDSAEIDAVTRADLAGLSRRLADHGGALRLSEPSDHESRHEAILDEATVHAR